MSTDSARRSRFVTAGALFLCLLMLSVLGQKSATVESVAALPFRLRPSSAKLPDFFQGKLTPDVLILGSSLVSKAAVRSDEDYANVRPRFDAFYTEESMARYSHAKYFADALRRQSNKRLTVVNLAVYGANVSDDYLIFKKTLQAGRKPALLVCGVAPRDFFANDAADVEESTYYRVLSDPVDLLLGPLPQGPFAKRFWQRANLLASIVRQRAGSAFWETAVGFPPPHFDPAKGIVYANTPIFQPKADRLPDLWLYNYRYNPTNYQRMRVQMDYLQRMLSLAQDNRVPAIIIDMPLTRENVALIKPDVISTYRTQVKSLCSRTQSTYVDLQQACAPDDFEDSCHLDGTGGKKFFDRVLSAMSTND